MTPDVTVTIDPMNRQRWITDGDGFDAHVQSVQRGLIFDRRAFCELGFWHSAGHGAVSLFNPTTVLLDRLDKYSAPSGGDCMNWAGNKRDASRFGMLPVIQQASPCS